MAIFIMISAVMIGTGYYLHFLSKPQKIAVARTIKPRQQKRKTDFRFMAIANEQNRVTFPHSPHTPKIDLVKKHMHLVTLPSDACGMKKQKMERYVRLYNNMLMKEKRRAARVEKQTISKPRRGRKAQPTLKSLNKFA